MDLLVGGGQRADRPVRPEQQPVLPEPADDALDVRPEIGRAPVCQSASVTMPESLQKTCGSSANGAMSVAQGSRRAARDLGLGDMVDHEPEVGERPGDLERGR